MKFTEIIEILKTISENAANVNEILRKSLKFSRTFKKLMQIPMRFKENHGKFSRKSKEILQVSMKFEENQRNSLEK